VLAFTKSRLQEDHDESVRLAEKEEKEGFSYGFKGGLKNWPLNREIAREVDDALSALAANNTYDDVLVVRPHRSQMRSVIIFAVKKISNV